MKLANRDFLLWAPRIVGLGLALFLSLFALDAFTDPRGVIATIVALLMGLVPALITLAAVIIGWKHQGIAAIIFLVGAVFYAALALEHPDWIARVETHAHHVSPDRLDHRLHLASLEVATVVLDRELHT